MKTARIDVYYPYGSRDPIAVVHYRGKILREFSGLNVPYESYLSSQQLMQRICTSAKAWAIGAGFTRAILTSKEEAAP